MIRGVMYGQRQLMLRTALIGTLARRGPEIHKEIAYRLTEAVYRNHAYGGTTLPVGGWPALAPATVRRKRFFKHSKLMDSLRMLNAWRYRSSARLASIYNLQPYAMFHQRGTPRTPARKLFPPLTWVGRYTHGIVLRYFNIALRNIHVRSSE